MTASIVRSALVVLLAALALGRHALAKNNADPVDPEGCPCWRRECASLCVPDAARR